MGPDGGILDAAALERAYAYFEERTELKEIILTGGDPLILSPRRLGDILQRLAAIPHIEVLRIHSRVPVAAPELLTAARRTRWILRFRSISRAHHHASEITPATVEALRLLQRRGISPARPDGAAGRRE